MAAEYQEPDWHVVDYEAYCLDDRIIDPSRHRALRIRGPRPTRLDDGYFVCLGAAQTFGRFCARPFPTLLHDRLKLDVLNISHGGAGPSFFCRNNAALLEYVNSARFVVVQVMSGRSEGNSLYASDGVGHYTRRADGASIGCDQAFTELLRSDQPGLLQRIVAETRASWCESYLNLLGAIRVPKVLLWFSTRTPEYRQRDDTLHDLFGAFPQLVTREMLSRIGGASDRVVEVVTKKGLPHILTDRFTGRPTTVVDEWTAGRWDTNWYYPSPEMHDDAANALEPVCQSLLARSSKSAAERYAG